MHRTTKSPQAFILAGFGDYYELLITDQPASVQGFKPAIDSTDWTLIKVTHTLNDNGLTTQLALEIRATEIPG